MLSKLWDRIRSASRKRRNRIRHKQRHNQLSRQPLLEQLEDRRLLTVDAVDDLGNLFTFGGAEFEIPAPGVLGNDSGSPLTVSSSGGFVDEQNNPVDWIEVHSDGKITGTAPVDFIGKVVSFNYTATDGVNYDSADANVSFIGLLAPVGVLEPSICDICPTVNGESATSSTGYSDGEEVLTFDMLTYVSQAGEQVLVAFDMEVPADVDEFTSFIHANDEYVGKIEYSKPLDDPNDLYRFAVHLTMPSDNESGLVDIKVVNVEDPSDPFGYYAGFRGVKSFNNLQSDNPNGHGAGKRFTTPHERLVKVDADMDGNKTDRLWIQRNGNTFLYLFDDVLGEFSQGSEDGKVLGDRSESRISPAGDKLTDKDGNVRFFSGSLLRWIEDRNGNRTNYYYSGHRLTSIVDPVGRTTTFGYDGNGDLATITDFAGRVTDITISGGYLTQIKRPDPGNGVRPEYNFTYSGGLLSSYTDPDNNTHSYTYGDGNTLFTHTYPNGATTTLTAQQTSGLVVGDYEQGLQENTFRQSDVTAQRIDELGNTWLFTTDMLGRVLTETDPLGNVRTWGRDQDGRALLITEPDPDGAGPLPSPWHSFTYDVDGRLVSQTSWATYTESWSYNTSNGQPLSYTNPYGKTTYFTQDSNGNITNSYTTVGMQDDPQIPGGEDDDLHTDFTYTTLTTSPHFVAGLVETMTDALGRVTSFTYNADAMLEQTTFADGSTVSATYDGYDRLATYTDEISRVTAYLYDNLDRLTTLTLPDTTSQYSWEYDVLGRVTREVDPLLRETDYSYDSMSNLTRVDAPDHDGAGGKSTTSYDYDLASRLTKITDPLSRETSFLYNAIHHNTTLTLPDPDGAGPLTAPQYVYTTDPLGRVTKQIDPLGNETDYLHESFGYHLITTHPDLGGGNRPETETIYNSAGDLEKIIDPLDREVLNTYDEVGRLVTTGWGGMAEWATVHYAYDAVSKVVSQTDELGNVTDFAHDLRDRLTQTTLPAPELGATRSVYTNGYDAAGQLTSTTDPLTNATTYTYNDLGQMTQVSGPGGAPNYGFLYDAANNLLKETDPLGNETDYTYDAHNNLIEIQQADPDGAGPATRPVSTFTYDDVGKLLTTTDPLSRVTTYAYDDLDRLLSRTDPDPGTGSPVTSFSYDAVGNLLSVVDPLSNPTDFQYDALYRNTKITQADPDGAGPATRPEWTMQLDDAGQLLSQTDPLGRITDYQYNDLGQMTQIQMPDLGGGAGRPTEQFTFDLAGNLLWYTDPNSGATEFQYDDMQRRVKVIESDPDGFGPDTQPETTFNYDLASQIIDVTDPMDRTTVYTYDALGRISRVTMPDPDGAGPQIAPYTQTNYDAASNVISQSNALAETTSYAYDNLHRRTSLTDASNDATTFTFDAVGNLLTLTDAVNNTTTWTYDALDRAVTETNALADVRTFEYDAVGNMVGKVDRNARETEYVFDNLYRMTEENWLDGVGATTHTLSYDFDAVGNLTSASDTAASYTYAHDALDRVTSITTDLASINDIVTLTQTFDAASNRTQLKAQFDGKTDFVNNFSYDPLNRLTRIEQTSELGGNAVADKQVDFDYNLAGQIENIKRWEELNSGLAFAADTVAVSFFEYDEAGRLIGLQYTDDWAEIMPPGEPLQVVPAGNTHADYDWSFDAANRVTQFVSLTDGTADYSYDDRGQVTDETYDYLPNTSHTYDANGNRTATGYSTGTNNQLLSDGTYDYTYDDEGNRTRKTHIVSGDYTDYVWDYRNRLTQIKNYDSLGALQGVVSYEYDVFDRRVNKTDAPAVGPAQADDIENYIYDGAHIALNFDGDGDLTNRYLHGPAVDQILADEQLTSTSSPGEILWPLTDNLGTVRDIAEYDDATGITSIANHIVYDAFGEIQSETDSTVDHIFAYTGRERDEESDLQYNRARYYDATVGRWISEDPIGFNAGDTNVSRYVGNEAPNATDPSGLIDGRIQRFYREHPVNPTTPKRKVFRPNSAMPLMALEGTKGIAQGQLNIWNGLTDFPIDRFNDSSWLLMEGRLEVQSTVFRRLGAEKLADKIDRQRRFTPSIKKDACDWSRGLITQESDASHGWSKWLGATGIEIVVGVSWTKLSHARKAAQAARLAAAEAEAVEAGVDASEATRIGRHINDIPNGVNAPRGGVPRIGQPVRGRTITEVPLDDLIPVHPVPRPDVPATHIADIAESIQHGTGRLGSGTKGFNVAESIPVLRMPDGRLVIGGGHHRVAAMRHLKESTIPAHITDWADFTLKRRQQIIKRLQGKYPEFFQRHPEYLDPNFGL